MKRNDIDANVGNVDCDNSADRSVRVGWRFVSNAQ